jgi:ABC-type multidrug transport system ATPase subunit
MSSATRLRIEVGQRPDDHHPDACGLVKPDGGGGTCLGLDIIRDAPQIRLQIGYMTQRFSFYEDLTVAENLDFVAEVYQLDNSRTAVKAIVDRMDLADRADQLAGELSGGWKQRLALAACVLRKPKLLLDEPTAGVDAKARHEFWDVIHDIASDGLTVIVSTHYMDEAECCGRIVYLSDGQLVVLGTPDEVANGGGLVTFDARGANLDMAARKPTARRGGLGSVRINIARRRDGPCCAGARNEARRQYSSRSA